MVVTFGSSSSYGQIVFLSIRSLASGGVALTSTNADAFTVAIIIDQCVPVVDLALLPAPVIALATADKTFKTVNGMDDTILAGVRYLSP